MEEGPADSGISLSLVNLPRVTITYCLKCRWMLRAAYVCETLGQSTFDAPPVLFLDVWKNSSAP